MHWWHAKIGHESLKNKNAYYIVTMVIYTFTKELLCSVDVQSDIYLKVITVLQPLTFLALNTKFTIKTEQNTVIVNITIIAESSLYPNNNLGLRP